MQRRVITLALLASAVAVSGVFGQPGDPRTDPKLAGPDFAIQGEFRGKMGGDKVGVQVIALGKGKFQAVILPGGLPGEGWDKKTRIRIDGQSSGEAVSFSNQGGWSASLAGDKFFGRNDHGDRIRTLRVHRVSPREGAQPPKEATVLFDGKSAPLLVNPRITPEGWLMEGVSTKDGIGSCNLHVEFRTSFMPNHRGQERSNSGVFLDGRYEVQILDSFGLEGENNECGGLYSIQKPDQNMCYPPLSWQTYDIEFIEPKFRGDLKVRNAVISVWHNGVLIHDQVQLPRTTVGNKEGPILGAIQLMNHNDPVRFKNVWMVRH